MGDLRKAAEMALEALKEYTDVVQSGTDPNKWHEVIDGGAPARKAIKALHQALEQPKRDWVDLTEEDIQAILKEWVQTDMTVREMLREAEAKLRGLNA